MPLVQIGFKMDTDMNQSKQKLRRTRVQILRKNTILFESPKFLGFFLVIDFHSNMWKTRAVARYQMGSRSSFPHIAVEIN
ncbi:MAG: hypothetical protein EBZ67_08350, partial [Chitinophagia bacterium]|nr:hypothetical protein [Chitinophagia bacterium]